MVMPTGMRAKPKSSIGFWKTKFIPAFYQRDDYGIPIKWVAMMRASMGTLASRFSANRMVREYTEQCYPDAAHRFRRRAAANAKLAHELARWHSALEAGWSEIRFGEVRIESSADSYTVHVQLFLGRVEPEFVSLELYADGLEGSAPERVAMVRADAILGAAEGWTYQACVSNRRPADHYTPRVVPRHAEAIVPLEAPEILWSR